MYYIICTKINNINLFSDWYYAKEYKVYGFIKNHNYHLGIKLDKKIRDIGIRDIGIRDIRNSGYWEFGILGFGKLEFGILGFGKMSIREIVQFGKSEFGKLTSGKCPFGKMAFGKMSDNGSILPLILGTLNFFFFIRKSHHIIRHDDI